MPTWNLVGTSTFTKTKQPTRWFQLAGDVSTIVVPLATPLPKLLEQYLVHNGVDKIMLLWQSLVAPAANPDQPGYVEFPQDDDALRDVYFPSPEGTPGEPFDKFPWETDLIPGQRPTNWAALVNDWYYRQGYYGLRDFVQAFIDAIEAVSDLPLEQSAHSLLAFLSTPATGAAVSELKLASTTTGKKTGSRSGPRRTTSSPARSKG